MDKAERIACVTGASGMIGRKITQRLIRNGYRVRVLSRQNAFENPNTVFFKGDLEDESILNNFIANADLFFHCAAELYDESKMWRINVSSTKSIVDICRKSGVKYFCYISSAGVIGKTNKSLVDETEKCNPQNLYELSKWEAEKIVAEGINGCNILILRPTDVIDDERPGAITLPKNRTLLGRLIVFLKGGECAHIVHAEDVAEAAMFLISKPLKGHQCFFISCDHEVLNTFAGLWALYRTIENNRPIDDVRPVLHLPLIIPHILRRLWRGTGNRGDVRYSSQRLIDAGFTFHLGLEGAVRRLISIGSSN